jgi:hypothetical protein
MAESVLSPLYADRFVIGPLSDKLTANSATVAPTNPNTFWCTPQRSKFDTTREIFEVRLPSDRLINSISFDHSHFPHELDIEYMDSFGLWQPITGDGGQPFFVLISDSIPAQCNPKAVMRDKTSHPEHSTGVPNHWIPQSLVFPPITTSRVRLVLSRVPTNLTGFLQAPIWNTSYVDYSLAVRSFNLGYKVTSVNDIPIDAFQNGNTFASTTDVLGSNVSFNVYREKPSDIFKNKYWKCEPQPVPYAVVNFYADVRDASGLSQIIDRFYLDPLYVGPTINLYYSNDNPNGTFKASDDTLGYPATNPQGGINPQIGANNLKFDGTGPSFVDIINSAIQFDSTQPWWIGLQFVPHSDPNAGSSGSSSLTVYDGGSPTTSSFSNSLDGGASTGGQTVTVDGGTSTQGSVLNIQTPLFDFGSISVDLVGNSIRVSQPSGVIVSAPFSYSVNNTVNIGLVWMPIATDELVQGLHLYFGVPGSSLNYIPIALNSIGVQSTALRIGGYQGSNPGVPNFDLNALILKQEVFAGQSMTDFNADAMTYVRKPFFANGVDRTGNSILRFNAHYATTDNPLGFVGGPGVYYEGLNWTPVLRHFVMQKGNLTFPPTMAKYFKFEITNLVAEPYEVFQPITTTVKMFSAMLKDQHSVQIGIAASASNPNIPGLSTVKALTYNNRYADGTQNLQGDPVVGKYGPTSALYSTNPEIAQALQKAHWTYGFQAWQRGQIAPRFQQVGTHEYETVQVTPVNKLAYFAGIKQLQAFRLDYLASNDTAAYDEYFTDSRHVASNTWITKDGHISTSSGLGSDYTIIQSVPYGSTRAVKGVQFAAQQTDAVLLNQNDLFKTLNNDGSILGFSGWGDGTVDSAVAGVTLSRTAPFRYGDLDGTTYGSDETYTYGDLERRPRTGPQNIGGMSSDLVTPSSAGRIHAAVRFIPKQDISIPLFLQIVGADETVLASTQIFGSKNQKIEAFVGYTVGSVSKPAPKTWGNVESSQGANTTYGQLNNVTYGSLETTVVTGDIRVRLVQNARSNDSFNVLALSLFDEGILWEFSNDSGANWYPGIDIRNDPNGVLMFPDLGTVSPHPTLQWRCRGYRKGLTVSGLRVRPWYAGLLSGIVPTRGLAPPGPNIGPYDHYSDVSDDPQFKLSHDQIPSYWYSNNRPIPVVDVHVETPLGSGDVPFTPPDTGGGSTAKQYFLDVVENIQLDSDIANTNRGPKIISVRSIDTTAISDVVTISGKTITRNSTDNILIGVDYADFRGNANLFIDTFRDNF